MGGRCFLVYVLFDGKNGKGGVGKIYFTCFPFSNGKVEDLTISYHDGINWKLRLSEVKKEYHKYFHPEMIID